MPDNDIVPRRIRRPYKKAAELAIGGHEQQLVADECGRALATDLREAACTEQILEFATGLERAIAAGDPEIYESALSDFRDQVDGSPLSGAISSEALHLLEASLEGRAVDGSDIPQALLSGGLRRLARGSLFGPEEMLQAMHKRALSVPDLGAYRESAIANIAAEDLASRLINNPDSEVRAPSRRAKASTAEMLDEDVIL